MVPCVCWFFFFLVLWILIQFSYSTFFFFFPPGRSWAATTTEGLLVYSLDQSLVFDPFELETEITPASVRKTLNKGDHSKALLMSFRLNEQHVIQEVVESIPVTDGIYHHFILQPVPDVWFCRECS